MILLDIIYENTFNNFRILNNFLQKGRDKKKL